MFQSIIDFFKALVLRYNAEMPKTMKTIKWVAGVLVIILAFVLRGMSPEVQATLLLPDLINTWTMLLMHFALTWGSLIAGLITFFTGVFALTPFTATNPEKNVAGNLALPLKQGIANVRADKTAGK